MKTWVILTLLAFASAVHAAEMYRWVDDKGVVNYTPYPPPPNIRKVEQKKLGDNVNPGGDQPYSLQVASKSFPVTLYITDCGELCKNARAHLAKRGVPFTEKNPASQDEAENFKKLTGGGMEVPLLVVGALKTIKGFQASEWDAALTEAGYPSTALPGAKPGTTPPGRPPAGK